MKYRIFKADYLFDGRNMLDNNHLLVTDVYGTIVEILKNEEVSDNIEILKGMITPGFINAHCHTELSHLRKLIPEKTGLVDFVFKVVTKRDFADEVIMEAIKNAEDEMLKNGIVAVGDICNTSYSSLQKTKQRLRYYNFVEVSGWHPDVAAQRFSKALEIFKKFEEIDSHVSIVPHAPYSVSEVLWGNITPFFSQKVASIHNQETTHEDDFFLNGSGDFIEMYKMMNIDTSFYNFKNTRSIQTYFKKFSKAASVILVHNTFTMQDDLDFINETKFEGQLISFCLCPNANLYIENALPPVELLLQNDYSIVVGTDSLASNHQLNILEELKTIANKFPWIETEILLRWATINGANALQMNDQLGSFEKGKKPGIVIIKNLDEKNLTEHSTSIRIL